VSPLRPASCAGLRRACGRAPLGAIELQRGVGVDDAAQLGHALAESLAVLREGDEIRSTDDEVDVERSATDVESGNVPHDDAQVAILADALTYLLDDVTLADVALERRLGLAPQGGAEQAAEAPHALVVRRHAD